MRVLAVVSALLFGGVAIHEWMYASSHPYAYGPAKVIAWAALAGFLLTPTIYWAALTLQRLDKELGYLRYRVQELEGEALRPGDGSVAELAAEYE
jgi:hypothetical protein